MMKKKKEFSDDPMMKELHEIRKNHHRETKGLNKEEAIKLMREYVRRELRVLGYELVSEKRGEYRISSIKRKKASA